MVGPDWDCCGAILGCGGATLGLWWGYSGAVMVPHWGCGGATLGWAGLGWAALGWAGRAEQDRAGQDRAGSSLKGGLLTVPQLLEL